MIIAYDARPLQPVTRHWGVGVVLDNLLPRLRGAFQFSGIAHRFPGAEREGIKTWPVVPRLNNFAFEASALLLKDFDVYWGTNDFLPALTSRPSLVTVHDLLLLKYPGDQRHTRFLAWRFASSVKRAGKVIADSKSTADDLLAAFPGIGKKLEVGLLGFEMPPEIGREDPSFDGLSHPRPFVVMLGAHRPRKNLGLAVAALARARERDGKLKLVVTGDVHGSFKNLVSESSEFVSCAGVLPKPDLFQLLKHASALMFPSLYEGFGFPMLEAMAAGCPVLALDTPVNREVANDAARLLPADPDRWAAALHELVSNNSAAQEMREGGFTNLRRFSWNSTAKIYAEAFADIGSNGAN
jgi:glycosyltransferase involved in cell wall biosynthesis